MMLVKRKREVVQVPSSRLRMLKRLLIISAVSGSLLATTYAIETTTRSGYTDKGFLSRIHDGLYVGLMCTIGSFVVLCSLCILYFSSGSVALKTLNLMMHERRVLFIIILLGIIFYIDNIVFYWAVTM